MPWTPRQVRYLESSGSPLTPAQEDKMNSELHSDPSLGHKKKGSEAMKKEAGPKLREMRIEFHHDKDGNSTGHTVHHEHMHTPNKSGAFMAGDAPASFPFGAGAARRHTDGRILEVGQRRDRQEGVGDGADQEYPDRQQGGRDEPE